MYTMNKSKIVRIGIGVFSVILLADTFIFRGNARECWGMLVMVVVMSLFGYLSKKFVK